MLHQGRYRGESGGATLDTPGRCWGTRGVGAICALSCHWSPDVPYMVTHTLWWESLGTDPNHAFNS